jgi:HD domain
VHVRNAVGRIGLLVRLNRGRNAYVAPERLATPESALTRAADAAAVAVLPDTLLNHSYRTYVLGRALGEVKDIEVDAELLFAAAMLHDVGLVLASGREDFTLTSARVARDVAERVGLSTAATKVFQTAITMHHSPRVTLGAGPVAYLLAAGAGVDVVGLRCWDLHRSTLVWAVAAHPREGCKEYFPRVWAEEAARVPQGRASLLRRYGALTAAIALAPFDE